MPELARRRIHGERHFLAGDTTCQFDGLNQQFHGVLVGRKVRGEPALVPDGGRQATFGQNGP